MEPDENGFHVWCPALKGCHSWGATKAEALEMIRDAIELWLEDAAETRTEIPERERIVVRLP